MVRSAFRRPWRCIVAAVLFLGLATSAEPVAATAAEVDLAATQSPVSAQVQIQANKDWQSTAISVQKGEIVKIAYVSGLWSPWPGYFVDARGCLDTRFCSQDPNQPANICCMAHAGLIGRIGSGRPFAVGKGVTVDATDSGIVSLRINDRYISDNSGTLNVRVSDTGTQASQPAEGYPDQWSGYVANGEYKYVRGSWTQPTANTCGQNETSAAAFWVGLDGFREADLEQIGTAIHCHNGQVEYFAWLELIPGDTLRLDKPPYSLLVRSDDHLEAEVAYAGSGLFLFSLQNFTQDWHFSASRQLASATPPALTSAEWIVESPGGGGSLKLCPEAPAPQPAPQQKSPICPLTNFGNVTFSSAFADDKSINTGQVWKFAAAPYSFGQLNLLFPKTAVSALTVEGTTFSVEWQRKGPCFLHC